MIPGPVEIPNFDMLSNGSLVCDIIGRIIDLG